MSRLNPWHRCDQSCYWWGPGQEEDFCNIEVISIEAHTGRPGCIQWICAGCGGEWSDGADHSQCQVIHVELELT